MSENQLAKNKSSQPKEQLNLKAQIEVLKDELKLVENETEQFEAKLRSILIDLIIEEQELSDLYRRMQKVKKEKRLEQKKRGKNYKEPKGLKLISEENKPASNSKEDKKELKRLYRDAMLQVHPDKFSMNEDKLDLATEITSKLIEIYRSGNLKELQLFHAHIFSGNPLQQELNTSPNAVSSLSEDSYLKHQKEELEQKLAVAKSRPTYIVLKDYQNPMHFAEELKDYYEDRLFKLRKRTRKERV
tara:strand:+ start:6309 stop:7043 length:735 start_codon:yes stop_codon:yes gene_type:complete